MDVKINIRNQHVKIPEEIIQAAGEDELLARIFFNRGYRDAATIVQMLDEGLYEPVTPWEFPQMQAAVERIVRAVESKEQVAVYGDYDVDGVTATATLVQCLRLLHCPVVYHVPDRFTEGYGMNEEVIRSLADNGASLVITCDCGISNSNEIALAKQMGLDVIVTDHHTLPDVLPAADVILNPRLLGEGHRAGHIPGCGMAYFLCCALLGHYGKGEQGDLFLDLLALALVADVVSLNGENRYLLKKAMPKLFATNRTGLQALFRVIEKDSRLQTEEDIAFQIAPRINAAGRMESARLPVELLLGEDPQAAAEMAQRMDFLNKERKRLQQEMVNQAIEMVETRKKNKTVLVLAGEFWHHGIIGIAAGKICETYRKPAILLTLKEDGKTVVGSARSTDEIDIHALIKECSGKLLKFGGHTKAAGLSLKKEDVEAFTAQIEELAEKKYFIKDTLVVDVDMELGVEKADEGLYNRLCSAGPYGEGFEAPVFVARGISVVSDRKTEKDHHFMVLAGGNNVRVSAVKWFGGEINLQGKVFDMTYRIGWNTYRGNSELQLTVGYVVEAGGRAKTAFEGRFIDGRKMALDSILGTYTDALVFYEGLTGACPVKNTVDRHGVGRAKNLVFLSTPVNTPTFREVISLANPENVILNFSVLPDYSFKGFVMNLLGLIKFIVNNQAGRTQVEALATRLCVEENILRAALKYLRARGMVEYSLDEDNGLLLCKSDRTPDAGLHTAEKNLRDALEEKHAYRQFILGLEAERFGEYLK